MNPSRAMALQCMLAVLLAGCSGLHSNQQATQVYTLQPGWPAAAGATSGAAGPGGTAAAIAGSGTLLLARPLAAPGLGGDRIALTRGAQQLDYYAGSRWPAPLPELVQSLALEALRAGGRFRAVQSDGGPFDADYLLQLEIRRFQADYAGDGAPTVHVQLVAALGRRSDRSLIDSVVAEASARAGDNRMQPVIAAFQAALGDALAQLAARLQPVAAGTAADTAATH